jgi:hypothetical protein
LNIAIVKSGKYSHRISQMGTEAGPCKPQVVSF